MAFSVEIFILFFVCKNTKMSGFVNFVASFVVSVSYFRYYREIKNIYYGNYGNEKSFHSFASEIKFQDG